VVPKRWLQRCIGLQWCQAQAHTHTHTRTHTHTHTHAHMHTVSHARHDTRTHPHTQVHAQWAIPRTDAVGVAAAADMHRRDWEARGGPRPATIWQTDTPWEATRRLWTAGSAPPSLPHQASPLFPIFPLRTPPSPISHPSPSHPSPLSQLFFFIWALSNGSLCVGLPPPSWV
jgi:hypothetical protein